ncbi:MAG: TlpA disulfide reductase family protein [Bacteroidota bacterium]
MDLNTLISSAIVMMLVGLGFIYMIIRNKKPNTRTPTELIGVGLSALLIVFSGMLLVMGFTIGDTVHGPFSDQKSSVGRDAPAFSFTLLGSEESKSLDDYKGEVVLLNFWATWCPPCLDEMPDLNRLYADYREQGLRVITISDESREELVAFNEFIPLDTESGYIDDGMALPLPYVKMMEGRPESYVIDRDGTIREFILGARNYEFFKASIAPYL